MNNRITLLVVRDAGRPVRQLQLSKPLALAVPAAAALSLSSLVTSMHFHASQSIAQLEAEAAALSLTNLRMEMKVADKDKNLLQLRSQVADLSEEAGSIKDKLKRVSELEQQLQALINKSKSSASGTASSARSTSGADAPEAAAGQLWESAAKSTLATAGSLTAVSPAAGSSSLPSGGPSVGSTASAPLSSVSSLPAITFRIGAITSALGRAAPLQVGGEYIAVHQQDPFQLVEETKEDFAEIRSIIDEMVNSISTTISEVKHANNVQANIQAKKAVAEKARRAATVLWPTESRVISSNFGYRSDPFKGVSAFHSGIDIVGNIGDPIFAALAGEVTVVDQMGARGKYIILKHPNGLETWYMHLNGMVVSPGQQVNKGQKIGMLGSTGRSTGPHLHFQVVKQNQPVNPLTYVNP